METPTSVPTTTIPIKIAPQAAIVTTSVSAQPLNMDLARAAYIQGVATVKDAPQALVASVLPTTSLPQPVQRVIVPLEENDVAKTEEGVETVASEISEVINAVEEGKVRNFSSHSQFFFNGRTFLKGDFLNF